jgi:hypothetical protein
MIPYTARELISIGEDEFKWIEEAASWLSQAL